MYIRLSLLTMILVTQLLLPLCSRAAKHLDRPNILLVLCDDLGYGDLACYGSPTVKTPNVDRFAGAGMRFTDFYSAAPNCSPSRTGLMTGRTPTRLGIHNWIPVDSPMHVKLSETTIATILRKSGYDTAMVGKWHLNGGFHKTDQPQPNDHGFDHWMATQNNAIPTHHNPDNFYRNGIALGTIQGYASQIVTDESLRWLSQVRDRNKPFFLFVSYHEPHEPIASAPEFTVKYPKKGKPSRYDPSVTTFQAHHGNISQMDFHFGRLIDGLKDRGLDSNTLIIFTSDNGPAITGSHPHGFTAGHREKKGHTYDGGIRVPGIMVWPGQIKAGTTNNTPVGGIDILPTLAELAGIKRPATRPLDGTSVVAAMYGKPINRKQPLYWHFNASRSAPKVAIRKGPWKLLATVTGEQISPYSDILGKNQDLMKTAELDQFQLYNLETDPAEKNDLLEQEKEIAQSLIMAMTEIYLDVRDESPIWPIWKSPRWEGKRINDFVRSLNK